MFAFVLKFIHQLNCVTNKLLKCNFPGGVFLALSHGCRRRGRNYVSIRGECKNFLYVFLLADCNEYSANLQNGENMDIGYDYEKCIGLKVKPRKGDGLLFYSLTVNGSIDRVRAGLSKWPLLVFPIL